MKKILMLLALFGLVGCGKRESSVPVSPPDPPSDAKYVQDHHCAPLRHFDAYKTVSGGVEEDHEGFTSYDCPGIENNVYVHDFYPLTVVGDSIHSDKVLRADVVIPVITDLHNGYDQWHCPKGYTLHGEDWKCYGFKQVEETK